MLGLGPEIANANCFEGKPTYGDITAITVTRCQSIRPTHCFHAVMTEGGFARLTAYRLDSMAGRYKIRSEMIDGRRFVEAVSMLNDAAFFDLRVPYERAARGQEAVHVDGERDDVYARACNQHIGISVSTFYDARSTQYARFMLLMGRLTRIIESLPWQKDGDGVTLEEIYSKFLL